LKKINANLRIAHTGAHTARRSKLNNNASATQNNRHTLSSEAVFIFKDSFLQNVTQSYREDKKRAAQKKGCPRGKISSYAPAI
jgi:hypothetical protein